MTARCYTAPGLVGRVVSFQTRTHTLICRMRRNSMGDLYCQAVEVYELEDGLEMFRGWGTTDTMCRLQVCAIMAAQQAAEAVGARSIHDDRVWLGPNAKLTYTV